MLKQEIKTSKAKQLREQGYSFKQIAEMLDTKPSTAWDWVTDRKRKPATSVFNSVKKSVLQKNLPISYIRTTSVLQSAENEESDDVKEFISQLVPIMYEAPKKPRVIQQANDCALVIGDIHFGSEDWNVIDLFLQAVDELKPSTVILNGDTLDMFAISRYPKDIRQTYSLFQERQGYHKFLKMLHDITEPYQTNIYETNSNHSGDGNEGRWWRYLSDRFSRTLQCFYLMKNGAE